MKKIICLICAIAAIIALFVPITASAASGNNTSKKYAAKITEEGITQNLKKESQKRWYTFTTEKEGDAIIIFDNTADTVYSYYWYMTVYKKDGKTVIKEGNVEGGGKTTRIILDGLEAGKYYICIARSSGGNPFMIGYTDAEYTINLITADTQRPVTAEEEPEDNKSEDSKNEGTPESDKESGETTEQGRVLLIEKKNAVLCSLDGKLFVKENEGAAMVAYYTNKNGQTGPILVGETEEAVKYYSSNAGEGEFEYGVIKYDDKQYYYSCAWCFVPGTLADTLTPSVYKCSAEEMMDASYAARELLNVYFGKDPKDGFKKAAVIGFIEQYWFGLAIGVIVLIVIIAKIIEFIRDNSSSSYSSSYRSSSYSGSSYSGSSYSGGSYSGSSYGGSSSSYDDYGISKPAYDYNHVTVGEQDYRVYGSGSSQYYEDAEGYKHSTDGMDVQEPFNWLDL